MPTGAVSVAPIRNEGVQIMTISNRIDYQKPTILIADDEPHCRNVLIKMVEVLGYAALPVRDGKEAVETFTAMKNKIDLVILDMKMPFNGEKAYTKLRKIDKRARILLISGYIEDHKIRALLEQGYSGFLEKPFNLNSLKENIAHIILSNRQTPSATSL